jgi:hypothetical protein
MAKEGDDYVLGADLRKASKEIDAILKKIVKEAEKEELRCS